MDDLDLCILDRNPDDIGVYYSSLVYGIKVVEHYPEHAVIRMSDDRDGLKLQNLLGNTSSFLIVDKKVKEVIENKSKEEIEYLSFDLLDHKGRVHSSDYFIINPIGDRDCLNYDLSEIEYFEGDVNEVIDIKRYVLDSRKLKDQPTIFRIKEEPTEYVISEDIVNLFIANKFTNILTTEIEQIETQAK